MNSMTSTTELPQRIRARIGDAWIDSAQVQPVFNPYTGDIVAMVPVSTSQDLDQALRLATRAKGEVAAMPGFERARLLRNVADLLESRTESIATAMTWETGKAIVDARAEVVRSADTLRLCAEEAVRIEGEHVPMDASAAGHGKLAMVLRTPVGVVGAITPFNAPINLAAHKLGPALAAGNPIVIKPSPKAPLAFHRLIETFVDAGVPSGFIAALYGDEVGPLLVSDSRVDFVSFTGSSKVGAAIRARAGLKRVALELGGAAPTIVHEDADWQAAALQCAKNAMQLAGQSCVSVQNMYVHEAIRQQFTELVCEHVGQFRVGDPMAASTDIGTLIDEVAARRVETMVDEAVQGGAKVLCGGGRRGAQMDPVVLTGVVPGSHIVQEEIFGPVASILGYQDLNAVFDQINQGRSGLQTGIFTKSIHAAMQAARTLKMGGIIVNGTSRWRSDQMPYGGVKDSGIGREGPKYAIRDMTDETLLVISA
ncbi:aldehyde dehydrogenase family protein [Comamonas sp. Y33R10-2]|uniref:aldehyde dehydrogenase family protein n=1 Tax=Comamonas sp. Y33R10-2 TaxID=2853257 RepID=UPI001C5CAFB0|nr:aldehyde dehydrogenase family protein [Comamonas sp. Y33R10-2]QXZ10716.1 aldehyde dehydrogenase family protein [Comamonas sp. Y33R10-2]